MTLQETKFKKGSVLSNAVKYLKETHFQKVLGKNPNDYPRMILIQFLLIPLQQNYFEAVEVEIPGKGTQWLIELEGFEEKVNQFLNTLKKESETWNEIQNIFSQHHRNFWDRYFNKLEWKKRFSNHPLTLSLVEKFNCKTIEDYFNVASKSKFPPAQHRPEIFGLLSLLCERNVKTMLEIGTNRGGTLYLYMKSLPKDAKVMTMDIKIQNRNLLESFKSGDQKLWILEGNSTHPDTIQKVKEYFPDGLDYLFIDGDHSYEGVKQDFINYSPLVKKGGLIGFHDIIEDNETRYGIITGGWAGGVPQFWNEIKDQYNCKEFVQNPLQDGLGLGVIEWEK